MWVSTCCVWIHVQVVGYGLSGDAYNSTAPCEDGDGALRSMRMALQDAGVQPSEVRRAVYGSGSGTCASGGLYEW
jgi:3-oxoacyl-(acyl-carrier-protein) synthase